MTSYTVHFPRGTQTVDEDALVKAVLIKDGFSWGAFFFNVLWLFWNRLWIAGFAVMFALGAISALFEVFHVNQMFMGLADILLSILVGLEANSLKRWTFQRTGRPVAAVVTGHDYIEAEARMIASGLHQGRQHMRAVQPQASHPQAPVAATGTSVPAPALGLFPVSERSR